MKRKGKEKKSDKNKRREKRKEIRNQVQILSYVHAQENFKNSPISNAKIKKVAGKRFILTVKCFFGNIFRSEYTLNKQTQIELNILLFL